MLFREFSQENMLSDDTYSETSVSCYCCPLNTLRFPQGSHKQQTQGHVYGTQLFSLGIESVYYRCAATGVVLQR